MKSIQRKQLSRSMKQAESEDVPMRRMDKRPTMKVSRKNSYRLQDNVDQTVNECCAIDNKFDKYSSPHNESFTQTMYNITSIQLKSNRRYANIPKCRATRRRIATTTNLYDKLYGPSLAIVIALALASCIFNIQVRALSTPTNAVDSNSPSSSSLASQNDENVKQNPNDRQDSTLNKDSVASSSQSSIVASLSSAVASAAAAAAVAAAQNTLSGGDARSLLTGPSNSPGSSHQPRSPGLNLAMKIADAIPEVPYSILHNMKKLDHAAPFYNVANKIVGGSPPEPSHSFLASTLSGAGGLSSASEQLTSLFRSPFWKRIADGYGEFTSEFRSLFRAPPTTMKGPLSPTAKLLRDISVPALLMLLATTIPSEWRPVRTKRKSHFPVGDLASAGSPLIDPIALSGSEQIHYAAPTSQQLVNSMGPATARLLKLNSIYDQQMGIPGNQIARTGNDINLHQLTDTIGGNWMSAQPAPTSQNQNLDTPIMQQQPIKRVGDSATFFNADSKYQQDPKPVKPNRLHSSSASSSPDQVTVAAVSPFSSLTSALANQVSQSKLMNRIMNANTNDGYQLSSYRAMSLSDSHGQRMSPVRQDHLGDKHKYTLVGMDDNDNFAHFGGMSEQKLSPSSKPFLLSAMTHAISSMFNSESGSSSSGLNKQTASSNGDNIYDNHYLIGHKTINHLNSPHQQHQHPLSRGVVEQRELSQLLPQSWKDAVKRTVNNVQQQASTQWRSIEGQFTNWFQDKLKTLPIGSLAGAPSGTSSSPAVSNQGIPVANIIASVSSSAMNMLGIGGGGKTPSPTVNIASSASNVTDLDSAASQPIKNDSPGRAIAPVKGALAGVANMIVNTLTKVTSSSTAKPSGVAEFSSVNPPSRHSTTISGAQSPESHHPSSSTSGSINATVSL